MFDISLPNAHKSSQPAGTLKFLPVSSPRPDCTLDIVIVPRYGKQFDSRNELSWATDALPRLLPSARLLMVQYDFKMLPENPVDSLVTSFLDLLDGERQAAEQARPIIFVAWAFGRLIVSEAMRKATRSEHEWPWIQSAARQIFDPESALTLAPKPKRWLKVFDTGTSSTTINPVFHLRHRQTSPGLKRVKTWPVGVGKQINDFLKSLEHLCDEFEIHISEVSLQRTHTLPASRKSARAGIDTLSNAIADQISREQGIDVKRCQRNSLKGNDATDIRIDIIIIEELQRLATEVQVEASAMRLQEPPHDGINTIDNDPELDTHLSQTPSVDIPDESSIESLTTAFRNHSSSDRRPPDSGFGSLIGNAPEHNLNDTHEPLQAISSSVSLDNRHPLAPRAWRDNIDCAEDLYGKYSVSEEGNAFERVQATNGNWLEIQRRLPLGLQFNIYFQNDVWVYTGPGSEETLLETPIPLRIARAPVITVPRIKPFWHSGSGGESIQDPIREPADPKSFLDEDLAKQIFNTYPFAQGFHLFFNGSLQLLVPKDFEKSRAKRMYPQIFAGFRVSFLSSPPIPTATATVTHTARSTQAPTVSTQPTSISPSVLSAQCKLQCGSRILISGRDGKGGSEGRIGVRLRLANENDKEVFTIASHVAVQSQEIKNSWKWSAVRQWRKWRNKAQSHSIKGLQVLDAVTKNQVGTIYRTFDSEMGEFPAGYEHDLAYVEPSSQVDVSGIISSATRFCPDPNEPYEGRKLYLLCSDADLDHEYGEHVTLTQEEFRAVQIPAMCIGQSWWKSAAKRKMASGQAADAIYSKAILYRWFFRSAGTTTLGPFSGAALYAKSDCTSASGALETADMILGFQSFELINEGGNYDTDLRPNKEYKRNLILGNEKVFGAMIAPGELIEGKNIMVL